MLVACGLVSLFFGGMILALAVGDVNGGGSHHRGTRYEVKGWAAGCRGVDFLTERCGSHESSRTEEDALRKRLRPRLSLSLRLSITK